MEPERHIEKLLRAFAKKRRADAVDLRGLHPATRWMLQAEVARQHAEAPEEESVSLWQLFRQRWAVLLGFALLIFFCASVFLPALSKAKSKSQSVVAMSHLRQIGVAVQLSANENNGQLPATLDALTNGFIPADALTDPVSKDKFVYIAGGEKLDELEKNSILAFSPRDKKGRTVLLADGSVQVMSAEQFAERSRSGLTQHYGMPGLALNSRAVRAESPPANYPAAAAPPAVSETANVAMNVTNINEVAPGAVAAGDNVVARNDSAMESRDQLAMAGQQARFKSAVVTRMPPIAVNNVSQKFVQTVALSAEAKAPPVLATFEVRQMGNSLTVVDRDGSVYDGFVSVENSDFQNSAIAAPTQTVQFRSGQASTLERAQAQANYTFRVEGQNRTSRQNIVFAGNLVPLPGTNAVTQPSLISNARITGTVTVDVTNQIKIDAVPASP